MIFFKSFEALNNISLRSVFRCFIGSSLELCSYQKRRGVKGCNGDGIKDLRFLQGLELFFSVAQHLLQEGLLPGVELQDLYSVQDLIHQSDAAVHALHLDLLWTRHKGFY